MLYNQVLTDCGKTEVCTTSRTGTGECKMICQMDTESLCIPSEVFWVACRKRVSCVFMSICVFMLVVHALIPEAIRC